MTTRQSPVKNAIITMTTVAVFQPQQTLEDGSFMIIGANGDSLFKRLMAVAVPAVSCLETNSNPQSSTLTPNVVALDCEVTWRHCAFVVSA